jgi:hypothetical protein
MDGAATLEIDPRFRRVRTLFFGIGAQKAATTWLDAFLRGHPEVCLPVRKEQHYWTTIRGAGGKDRHARASQRLDRIARLGPIRRLLRSPRKRTVDEAWRLSAAMLREDQPPGHGAYADVLFQAWAGEPVAGEVTPAYALLSTSTFAEMAALGEDVRFIFIMRDPVSRLISSARMNARKWQRLDAPRRKPAAIEAWLAETLGDPADGSLLRSRYDLTIERLERAVPRGQIGYFFYETLFRQDEIDRLTDFLGVGRHAARFEQRVNAHAEAAMPQDVAAVRRLEAQALEVLAPTYDFVRRRFGDRVPAKWRHPEPARALARA